MPEIAIVVLHLDHIEPTEPAKSLWGGLLAEPLLVTSLRPNPHTHRAEDQAISEPAAITWHAPKGDSQATSYTKKGTKIKKKSVFNLSRTRIFFK